MPEILENKKEPNYFIFNIQFLKKKFGIFYLEDLETE